MKRVLFALLVASSVACDKSAPTGPAPLNLYVLVRVNGEPLPYTQVLSSGGTREVLNGEIRLMPDGSYSDRTRLREAQGSFRSTFYTLYQGPYAWDGSTITFSVVTEQDPAGNTKYSGTLAQDTLTIQAGSTTWKYVDR